MKTPLAIILVIFLNNVSFCQELSDLEMTMANSRRPIADQSRDENRRPLEILKLFGVKKGDSALDIIAMGGWYSEILSYAVGDGGVVFMLNNPIPLTARSSVARA